jgi:hypothetical protein
VRTLVTSANAKCKVAEGKNVKAMATAIGREEKGNCDNNVVEKNPKPQKLSKKNQRKKKTDRGRAWMSFQNQWSLSLR